MSPVMKRTFQVPSPVPAIVQAMTGSTGERIITWYGDDLIIISTPTEPIQTCRESNDSQETQTQQGAPHPAVASPGRRSVADIRRLVHDTAIQLIHDHDGHDHPADGMGSNAGVLASSGDARRVHRDTAGRRVHETA